jgi:Tfp pilus assembly protein PilV
MTAATRSKFSDSTQGLLTPNLGGAADGFTLVEVCISLLVGAILVFSVHSLTHFTMQNRSSIRGDGQVALLAADYMDRLLRIPFGSDADLPASSAQLTELFNDDHVLGSATLRSLQVPPKETGHSFQVAIHGRPVDMVVRVTNDLDTNGTVTGFREGRNDFLKIEVFAQNRLVVDSLRAADPETTEIEK